jgi:transposase
MDTSATLDRARKVFLMTKTRREFAPEFKREAVAMLESSGRPIMQVAAELGIAPSMLRNWRRVVNGSAPRSRAATPGAVNVSPPLPTPADHAAENARLKRELDRTRMERDILKKAIGIFAEAPK